MPNVTHLLTFEEIQAIFNLSGTFPPENIYYSSNQPNSAELEAIWNDFPAKKRFDEAFKKYAVKPPKVLVK